MYLCKRSWSLETFPNTSEFLEPNTPKHIIINAQKSPNELNISGLKDCLADRYLAVSTGTSLNRGRKKTSQNSSIRLNIVLPFSYFENAFSSPKALPEHRHY
jgi:hypothetical protein